MDELLNRISHDPYLFKIDHYLPSAWIGHAPFLKYLIREQKPVVFVELGVHNGFSYFVGCQSIRECGLNAKAYAVDHWKGDSQAGYFDDSIYESVAELNHSFADFSTLFKMSFESALKNFEENSIDLLHIDGFHSYEAVKQDFESWLSKMSTSGIILLHDIHVRRDTFGVFRFWNELKKKYKTIEFVGSHGLGVVFLGEIPQGALEDFYKFSCDGKIGSIQGTFGSISDHVLQHSRNGVINTLLAERDSAIAERDSAIAERDSVIAERDSVIAERDSVIAENKVILTSTIWLFFTPYRKFKNLFLKN